jgi:hypothetical protein
MMAMAVAYDAGARVAAGAAEYPVGGVVVISAVRWIPRLAGVARGTEIGVACRPGVELIGRI